ncbi:MAG: PepSY-associated TM helix domain-containing protein [Edaphobacter sp.]|nr:PepSY-associated TM helix domain-containing protein [Edaphobacter sp.]MDE1175677.1 PepSY-associated TM helix domain-containing protein [Edaphobacter sp.]
MRSHSIRPQTVRTWYRIHKWSSLICTAFLLIACITGLPLVFSEQLEAILEPHVAPAQAMPGASVANVDAMVATTQARFPSLHPYNVYWDDDEPRVFVNMSPSDRPKDGDIKQAVFDVHTGKLLELPQDKFSILGFLLTLHSELFLGLPGELIMGAMALSFVISLLSGALVYGPFMRNLRFGTYRANGKPRTRWFDLHNLLGIVTLTWAVVVGATGVMNALSTPLFGLWRAQVMPAILAPYQGKPQPTHFSSVDAAVQTVATALPQMKITSVLFPNSVFGSPQHYLVWTAGRTPLTSRLMTPVLVDVQTGALTISQSLPWYLRLLEVSRPLHFGDYGGLPLRILWALFDIALIVVLSSGVYLWLVRRKAPLEKELNRLVAADEKSVAQQIEVAR